MAVKDRPATFKGDAGSERFVSAPERHTTTCPGTGLYQRDCCCATCFYQNFPRK